MTRSEFDRKKPPGSTKISSSRTMRQVRAGAWQISPIMKACPIVFTMSQSAVALIIKWRCISEVSGVIDLRFEHQLSPKTRHHRQILTNCLISRGVAAWTSRVFLVNVGLGLRLRQIALKYYAK